MTQKIESYQITSGTNMSDVEVQVNRLIQYGWRPFGGISCSDGRLYQAMVK